MHTNSWWREQKRSTYFLTKGGRLAVGVIMLFFQQQLISA